MLRESFGRSRRLEFKKLNVKIARLHQKISDTRKDFDSKLAHHLVSQAGAIFVEALPNGFSRTLRELKPTYPLI
jgi:transposase